MTNIGTRLFVAGFAVAGALAFSAPAMAEGGCFGGKHSKTTTTADSTDTGSSQSTSTVLTQSTKTATGG